MDSELQPIFRAMAELRYQMRRFVRFSENAARQAGLEPQQQQLLLAIKGLPDGMSPTIGALAERMQLQHHSVVGLIDRLVQRGLLIRLRATNDRRRVLVKLTNIGEKRLSSLTRDHQRELEIAGPRLINTLQTLMSSTQAGAHRPNKSRLPIQLHKKPRRHGKNG